ncbi:MAG: phosphoribosyl-AMP cyclohydrolase [Candidatus Altiarchaeales archaeon ex4484_96]|nr:MAG: phosphoribosyl-AMP cyclohydrolase [Candidatus Altiarchaeales archaeon ex4484_96]
MKKSSLFDTLKPRSVDGLDGLFLAVVQDYKSDEVLMCAFMDEKSLELTLETRLMHYFSTSRRSLWKKGESSGNIQEVKSVYVDCDGDALLFKVKQVGGACHMGYRSCFYRRLADDKLEVDGVKVFEPKEVYVD